MRPTTPPTTRLSLALLVASLLVVLSTAAAESGAYLNTPLDYAQHLTDVADGATVEGTLSSDSGRSFKDGSYIELFGLHGEEGEVLTLRVNSDFDSYLSLYGPDGEVLATDDDGGAGLDAAITTTLPVTGSYVAVISSYWAEETGNFTLTRGSLASTDVSYELDVPGTISGDAGAYEQALVPSKGHPGLAFTFTLHEPSVVSLKLASDSFDAYLVLTNAAGELLGENDDASDYLSDYYTTDSALMVELDEGDYIVYATDYFGAPTGAFTLEARRYVEMR